MFWKTFVVLFVVVYVHSSKAEGEPRARTIGQAIQKFFPQCSDNVIDSNITNICGDFNTMFTNLENKIATATGSNFTNTTAHAIKGACTKLSKNATCLPDLANALLPCIDEDVNNITSTLIKKVNIINVFNYVCKDGGKIITSFIVDKGGECFTSNENTMTQCLRDAKNNTLSQDEKLKLSNNTLSTEKHCQMISKAATCSITSLKKCKPATPGDIIENFYKLLVNNTCEDKPVSGSASSSYVISMTIMTFLLTLLF